MATWSPEQRAEAVQLLRDGVGVREVARRTGVPRSTLSTWVADEGIEVAGAAQTEAARNGVRIKWAQRRTELVDDLGAVAAELLQKARESGGRDAQAYMTAVAIGVDKAQLLSGGPTSRHEQLDAQRRRQWVDEKADELAQRRAEKDGATGG